VSLSLSSIGESLVPYDSATYIRGRFRLPVLRDLWQTPSGYVARQGGYVMSNANAQYTLRPGMTLLCSIQNLADLYRNDYVFNAPTTGRMVLIGLRLNH
jgi:hypothetical protein